MKIVFNSILLVAIVVGITTIFSSCEDEEIENPILITIEAPQPDSAPDLDLSELSIVLEDKTQGTTQSGTFSKIDATVAKAEFSVSPGTFSVTISGSGIVLGDDEVNVNGVAENFLVTRDGITPANGTTRDDMTLPINLSVSASSRIIIRQIYISGCKTTDGAYYRSDMFIELYNNGSNDYSLDSLCIGAITPMNAHKASSWREIKEERLALAFHKWMIPGTGKDHVLKPGEAAVLTTHAMNHTGTTRSLDLTNADFQFYTPRFSKGFLNPDRPVMTEIIDQPAGTTYVYSIHNPAFIIYRIPDFEAYIANKDSEHLQYAPGTSKRPAYTIPSEWVIDGVEIFQEGRDNEKRFPAFIDTGYALNRPSANGTGVRRVLDTEKSNAAGRFIYQDTNNSTNDFEAAACIPWENYE